MRRSWSERTDRLAWDTQWTVIGGRYRDLPDELAGLRADERLRFTRALSQVFIAATPPRQDTESVVQFWASTVRKVVQRGERPFIPLDAPGSDTVNVSAIQRALALHIEPGTEADVLAYMDHDNERDGWRLMGERASAVRRWTLPQADLQAIVGDNEGERWADFLVAPPWISPQIVELDGQQHDRSIAVDKHRDKELASVGIDVARVPSRGAGSSGSALDLLLRSITEIPSAPREDANTVHLPSTVNRLVYAIAEAVERGFLPVGVPAWSIDLDAPINQEGVRTALGLLAAIETSWDLHLLPDSIELGETTWKRSRTTEYTPVPTQSILNPQTRIVIDPYTSPVATLPDPDELPTIVIRSTHVPVDLPWTPSTTTTRLSRSGNGRTSEGLRAFLRFLFGFGGFREAQLESISRVLSGGDAVVLLPTGAGKTLIYQVAGLLQPGTTLIIAPLKSLIDDQERRLREASIDRTIAIHSGKGLKASAKEELHHAIGDGEALFVIVAPERLQIQGFRDGLMEAAQTQLVNLAVIDEAHCVSEWGHQFRTPYLRLGRNLRQFSKNSEGSEPPILALTATAGPAVLRDLAHDLDLDLEEPGLLHRPESFRRNNLHYAIHTTEPENRRETVGKILSGTQNFLDSQPLSAEAVQKRAGLVFSPWVNNVLGIPAYRNLVAETVAAGAEDVSIYSGKQPEAIKPQMNDDQWEAVKTEEIRKFRTGETSAMVATSAFGMGIDIPNIRYSVHIAMPPSIEAFAQESGRAGRDGESSACVLVASPATTEEVTNLLIPDDPDRRARYRQYSDQRRSAKSRNDVDLRLYFHYLGFPDVDVEVEEALAVFDDLQTADATESGAIEIPRVGPYSRESDEESLRERGLHRLAILGIVDDYTIVYSRGGSGGKLLVYATDFTRDSLNEAFIEYVERITAETIPAREWVANAPSGDPRSHIQHLVTGIVELAQSTIERGRVDALREMHRMVTDELSADQIQERIDSYLGAGQVASLLDRVVSQPVVSIAEVIDGLELAPPSTSEDWAGAGARYAESYPDHPVVSLVRAMGEAWRSTADQNAFNELLTRAFENLHLVESDEHEEMARWVLTQLRERTVYGDRSTWTRDVWNIMDIAGIPEDAVVKLENEAFDAAIADVIPISSPEVEYILTRRLHRLNNKLRPVLADIRIAS